MSGCIVFKVLVKVRSVLLRWVYIVNILYITCVLYTFWNAWNAVWWHTVMFHNNLVSCICAGLLVLLSEWSHFVFWPLHMCIKSFQHSVFLLWTSCKLFMIMKWSGQALQPHKLCNKWKQRGIWFETSQAISSVKLGVILIVLETVSGSIMRGYYHM